MTLLKDNNYKDINVALLSLEADIKNKITNFDTSVIDKQLAEINSRIDKINAGGNNTSAQINDIRYEIEDINSKVNGNSVRIENIEQKLTDIFSAENKVTDFNTTTNSGIYYWTTDAANRPGSDYGVLLVNKYDGGSGSIWINQIAYGTNGKIYFRQNINSGSWTEWKAVAFDGELTAKKVANALTVNGKTYDGSEAVDAGVQKIENGGTGATDAASGFNTLADGVRDSSTPADNEKMLLKPTGTWYKTTCLDFWNYIKSKISSVLGLTKDNYGGKAATAGTADTILDYNRNTPIKVRWGGPGIDSAEWYPAFNADGSALEPINRANIHAGTADKTVNDINIYVPFTNESGQYVIPFGNIPEPTSTAIDSPYNWDITGFFSIIRPAGHNGSHLWFAAGHGYSHGWTTYAYLDKFDFAYVSTSIKAFQYEGKWWLGLCINTQHQGYDSKMTITFSRGLPATPTCILYNSRSDGVANKEIYDSIQDIPSWWWKTRTIDNPTTFTKTITSPSIEASSKMRIPIGAPSSPEDGCIWIS